MTKKHFKRFAEEIARSVELKSVRQAMANLIMEVGSYFNPRFDEVKFLVACGLRVKEGEKHER